jgi:hypothetical protein
MFRVKALERSKEGVCRRDSFALASVVRGIRMRALSGGSNHFRIVRRQFGLVVFADILLVQPGAACEIQTAKRDPDEKETGRLEAFRNGVFAIATTLLILEI